MLGQIAPRNARSRNPEYPVQNKAMIPRTPPTARTPFDHEGFKAGPFLVTHQSPDQGSLPKAALNQILPRLGIPFVNTP